MALPFLRQVEQRALSKLSPILSALRDRCSMPLKESGFAQNFATTLRRTLPPTPSMLLHFEQEAG
jgi:hypothetical protein